MLLNGLTTETVLPNRLTSLPVSSHPYPLSHSFISLTPLLENTSLTWFTQSTAWSGGMPIDEFIEVSKKGRRNGDHIMHRENGTLVELNSKTGRAVGKMKATITQRFSFDGIEFDVECDCRFIMWCQKDPAGWKVHYKRLFYEKDKIMPVDGKHVPDFSEEELKPYPYGYRYLGASQARLGHKIKLDLPTMEDNDKFRGMYEAMEKWLRGEDVKETLGIPV
ncbi:uncharacterized protein BO87DRAFT_375246 [Aspergillus neoniger CBS 115656]|uniref:SnoaL-like domain-containing protein n=1 Tax=Aspergillus neoniger (strain CBS 115656) TaxID=1448310 RepID=A0A318YQN8_ASPNB|nr:hypothetical protein BO87DRAFT_375246 [Aspergillus neoniger CBS 115656]PYH36217.1 hypothetical protein BO87DRAFT_375246 [Aspergillus neoniger CBS 115656]